MTTIKNVTEKKKKPKILDFIMPIKSTTTMAGAGGGEKKKRIYRTSQNIRIINIFL